jgi:hypothetical protein
MWLSTTLLLCKKQVNTLLQHNVWKRIQSAKQFFFPCLLTKLQIFSIRWLRLKRHVSIELVPNIKYSCPLISEGRLLGNSWRIHLSITRYQNSIDKFLYCTIYHQNVQILGLCRIKCYFAGLLMPKTLANNLLLSSWKTLLLETCYKYFGYLTFT